MKAWKTEFLIIIIDTINIIIIISLTFYCCSVNVSTWRLGILDKTVINHINSVVCTVTLSAVFVHPNLRVLGLQ